MLTTMITDRVSEYIRDILHNWEILNMLLGVWGRKYCVRNPKCIKGVSEKQHSLQGMAGLGPPF